jgi:hypothetical protein
MLGAILSILTGVVLALLIPARPAEAREVGPGAICPACGRPIQKEIPGSWHCPEEMEQWQQNMKRVKREKVTLPYSSRPTSDTPVTPISNEELEAAKAALEHLKPSMSAEDVEALIGLSRFAVSRIVDRSPFPDVTLISVNYDLGNGHRMQLVYDRKPSALRFRLATIVLDRALWLF